MSHVSKAVSVSAILVSAAVLASCAKIQPENPSAGNISERAPKEMAPSGTNLLDSGGVVLEEEPLLTERFRTISSQFKTYEDLFASEQYRTFVKDVHGVFAKYKKEPGKHEKELAYIFDKLIPKLVMYEWVSTKKIDENTAELIIQSIKRKDFNTMSDKELITEKFKIEFEEKSYNPLIKSVDDKLKSAIKGDDAQFRSTVLEPETGLVYSVLMNRYEWNKTGIGYKPADMEADFMKYLDAKFEKALAVLGTNPKELEDRTYRLYGYSDLRSLGDDVLKDFQKMVSKYGLESKMPVDRYYRNDEENDLFKDQPTVDAYVKTLSNDRKAEFEEDLRNFRLKMYLLSYFGRHDPSDAEQGLWSSRARSDYVHPVLGKGVQNLFRLSRYIAPRSEVDPKKL